jgi:hypothetical protein
VCACACARCGVRAWQNRRSGGGLAVSHSAASGQLFAHRPSAYRYTQPTDQTDAQVGAISSTTSTYILYHISYTVESLCLDGCPQTYFFYSPTVTPKFFLLADGWAQINCLINARSCTATSTWSPLCTFTCVICVHWVGWQAIHLTRHAPMRTQNRQVADLGRTHTKSRAEHAGVCAVARGIHRNFRSAIWSRNEGARSAGKDRRL